MLAEIKFIHVLLVGPLLVAIVAVTIYWIAGLDKRKE
jgi:hypothetical protein